MGREIQHYLLACRIPKLFFDLRCMPVCGNAVRLDVFVHLAEEVRKFCASSGTGRSGLGIDDQGAHIDEPFFCQRISRQDGTGCVTARICDQAGFLHIFTVDLAQAVYRLLNILRGFMFDLVPLFINIHIFKPEIRAQVYDLCL